MFTKVVMEKDLSSLKCKLNNRGQYQIAGNAVFRLYGCEKHVWVTDDRQGADTGFWKGGGSM